MKRLLLAAAVLLLAASAAMAADKTVYKPYVLGSNAEGTIEKALPGVKSALEQQGFQVAGEYSPYKGAHVVVVTSDALKKAAAMSKHGGYGAIVRVSLTEAGKNVQVSYTNPVYFSNAYRMADDLAAVSDLMAKALGRIQEFGSAEGMTAKDLRDYHYMVMMPYFTDPIKLAKYGSQNEALKAVEAGLKAGKGGTAFVYRVDVSATESVFGTAITKDDGADAAVMKVVDIADLKHTAHLPYEVLVSDGVVYMLHGKFRIALDFPDLTMGTFMKISGAPGDIEDCLEEAAGKK